MTDEELTQAMTDAVIFGTGVMQDGKRIDPLSFFVQPVSDPVCEHCGMDPAALTEQLEAARADAKEAEAYAEELEAKNGNLCDLAVNEHGRAERAEAKLAKAVEVLRDLTNAFAKKVDVDQTRWKTPYEHPLSAYDRAVAFLKGENP
jgi:hypothetical protein